MADLVQSVAWKIAKNMKKTNGVSVFAPKMGLAPGAIRSFNLQDGPGNMVQWEARGGLDPDTKCTDGKWKYAAVTNNNYYKIICKLDGSQLQDGKFSFYCNYTDQ